MEKQEQQKVELKQEPKLPENPSKLDKILIESGRKRGLSDEAIAEFLETPISVTGKQKSAKCGK